MRNICRIVKYLNRIDTPDSQQGVSILAAIMALLILSTLGIAIITMVNMGKMISTNTFCASQSLYSAEAGIERGIRAVRDDAISTQTSNPSQDGFNGISGMDAASATALGSGTVTNQSGSLQYGGSKCRLKASQFLACLWLHTTASVSVNNFYQAVNLRNSRINKVEIGCRFRRTGGSGTVEIQYETGGATGATTASWDSSAWTTNYLDITADRTWTWDTINDSSFKITATASPSCSGWMGNITCEIDYLFIRITCNVDAVTEAWYSTFRNKDDIGSAITVSLAVGSSMVSQMPVYDEAEKVNINYATQTLMRYLFEECGVSSGDANTIASGIVTSRGSSLFDSIEEVKKVSSMTDSNFTLVKDYITVYSWINTDAQRPSGSRAPININTAPRPVLKAVLGPLGLGSSDISQLAADIITQRNTAPFTCMHTTDPNTTTDFADFTDARSYLSSSEKNAIKENCDASLTSWNGSNVVTTEFCYCSKVFSVVSTGAAQNSSRTVKRVFEAIDDDSDGIFNIHRHSILNCWKEISD